MTKVHVISGRTPKAAGRRPEAGEPGLHTPQRCGVWIPGPALRAVPE